MRKVLLLWSLLAGVVLPAGAAAPRLAGRVVATPGLRPMPVALPPGASLTLSPASLLTSAGIPIALPSPIVPAATVASPDLVQPAAQPEATLQLEVVQPALTLVIDDSKAAHVFDGAALDYTPSPVPQAPDYASLDEQRTKAPTGIGVWLKRLNPWSQPQRRSLSIEEEGTRQAVEDIHGRLAARRPQQALDILEKLFMDSRSRDWYRRNDGFLPYFEQAMTYLAHVEKTLMASHDRVRGRGQSDTLVSEAKAAHYAGTLLGHAYRRTGIQDEGSGHCVLHALYNAIDASTGWAQTTPFSAFIAQARAKLNKDVTVPGMSKERALALERAFNVKLSMDVDQGMGTETMQRFARTLGLDVDVSPLPQHERDLQDRLRSGRETLLTMRLFHRRYKQDKGHYGHEHKVLHHEVYLLGAFPSDTLGRWVYMVQDSGSGGTDFYTWRELQDLVQETQTLAPAAAAARPGLSQPKSA